MKMAQVIKGRLLWEKLKRKYHIDYRKVVLVLSGQNDLLDQKCMEYLPYFKRRKFAEEAIVIYASGRKMVRADTGPEAAERFVEMADREIESLFRLYCFYRFFTNIVFTHTYSPDDNQLQRFLEETGVDETDAACLALYHLREVPESG